MSIADAFQVGGKVRPPYFYDRKELLEEILLLLRGIKRGARNHVALVGPRQIGKSSIIEAVCEVLRRDGFVCVEIDCFKIFPSSLLGFLEYFSKQTYSAASSALGWRILPKRIEEAIRGIPSAVLELVKAIGADFRSFRVWIELRERRKKADEIIEEVLDAPEEIGKKFKVPVVIIIDEFQRLHELLGDDFLDYLRSTIYHQKHTVYLISGSQVGFMKKMLSSGSPFYKLFGLRPVGPLPEADAKKLIVERIRYAGYKISSNAVEEALKLTRNHPYYLQWLGRACLLYARSARTKLIKKEDVEVAFQRALKESSLIFEQELNRIGGRYRDLLIAVAIQGKASFKSLEETLGLPMTQFSSYLKKLLELGYLEKEDRRYKLADPVFAEYLRREYT